jgi:hypothetical protein
LKRRELASVLTRAVQVSFDEYLQDRARVFRAMFPDESRSQRLSDVLVLVPISHAPFLEAGEWID